MFSTQHLSIDIDSCQLLAHETRAESARCNLYGAKMTIKRSLKMKIYHRRLSVEIQLMANFSPSGVIYFLKFYNPKGVLNSPRGRNELCQIFHNRFRCFDSVIGQISSFSAGLGCRR